MNRHLLTALSLCCAAASAHATPVILGSATQGGLTIGGASAVTFSGYDGSASVSTGTLSQGYTGTLNALTAGTISFTYLGHESTFDNVFNFNGQHLTQGLLTGNTLSAKVGAGTVNFSFTSHAIGLFSWDTSTYANGSSIGAMAFMPAVKTSKYGNFDFVIGFNDKRPGSSLGDRDFDDFVVGVKFTPKFTPPAIPEPGTWALMALGLAGVAAVRRRRG